MGLDCDVPGIGRRIADAAIECGIDLLNVLYLTPLPGTRLWQRMESDGRIAANHYPRDWEHYTLNFPVAEYRHLSWIQLRGEMNDSWRRFYSVRGILGRVWRSLLQRRKPLAVLISSLSYRHNYKTDDRTIATLDRSRGESRDRVIAASTSSRRRTHPSAIDAPGQDRALVEAASLRVLTIPTLFVIPALDVMWRRFEGRARWHAPAPRAS
jgi:hypothetical protein